MKRWLTVLLACLMIFGCMQALAATNVVEPGKDFYYLDTANVLSEATEGEIYYSNVRLQEACRAQIVVVALDSIDGADTYDYALEMYNSWGIGSSEDNNGLLLLMAIQEDDYYALAGAGLESIFSSSELKKMYDRYLEDDFAAKDYDAGAKKFFEAAFDRVADYYNLTITTEDGIQDYENAVSGSESQAHSAAHAEARSQHAAGGAPEPDDYHESEGGGFMGTLLLVIVLLIIIGMISRIRGGAFWFWRPTFYWPIFGPRRRPPHHPHRGGPGGPGGPGPGSFGGGRPMGGGPRPGGFGGGRPMGGGSRPGGFGGGRPMGGGGRSFGGGAGRSSFGGGGGRSFGGGAGGGGRSFGGGAGRGRH